MLELITRRPRVRYLDHQVTMATVTCRTRWVDYLLENDLFGLYTFYCYTRSILAIRACCPTRRVFSGTGLELLTCLPLSDTSTTGLPQPLERTVEWMSAQVAAAWYSPKYKQHADEQLSPFVQSLRLDVPIP
ncbi:hypothetical protein TNCV_5130691 [Trichonephila clavipes]|nr:hypothetical protein TNCV_5130691 [Trichonephila clavipes]